MDEQTETPYSADGIDGGSVWGPLHRNTAALDAALGEATAALSRASRAAMWATEKGYPLHSSLADILGGLSTVVDGLIDQREELRAALSDD